MDGGRNPYHKNSDYQNTASQNLEKEISASQNPERFK